MANRPPDPARVEHLRRVLDDALAPNEDDDPDGEEHKNVYAQFGAAYFYAECLHRALVNVYAILGADSSTATRPWVEERSLRAAAMTMGELLTATKAFIPKVTHDSLERAVARRNHLAHGFWYENVHRFGDREGRLVLNAFLIESNALFREGFDEIDALVHERYVSLGITEDDLREVANEARAQPPPPAPERPLLKADERVLTTAAFVASATDGGTSLFLRDGDGKFWQLAEFGLGWCHVLEPRDDWRPYAALQKYLPASIVGRPKGATSWRYKLHITGRVLLVVEREADGRIQFGVRGGDVESASSL